MRPDQQAGEEYREFIGVKDEKDRKIIFKIIDYFCYASVIALVIAINVEWNLLQNQDQHYVALFLIIGIYTLTHGIEGLIDGKKLVAFLFGIPGLLSIGLSIILILEM